MPKEYGIDRSELELINIPLMYVLNLGIIFLKKNKQSGLTTQISTRPRATQQGRVKCRHHITVPAVPTQKAIPEEGGQ